jgi:hypothetical protein
MSGPDANEPPRQPLPPVLGLVLVGLFVAVVAGVLLMHTRFGARLSAPLQDETVRAFAQRHPHLAISTYPIDAVVSDDHGNRVELGSEHLANALFAFEPCGDDVTAARFGGMPPDPMTGCRVRFRLRWPDREHVVYVFEHVGKDAPHRAEPHFEAWARSIGAETRSWTSGGRRSEQRLDFEKDGRRWDVRIVRRRESITVYLPQGGFTPQ